MRLITLRLILLMSPCFIFCTTLDAQNCFNTGLNGRIINLPCNTNCVNVPIKIPHLKSSSSYTWSTIPYNPFPFTSPTGSALTETYVDDKFSHLLNMPFSFCFYDSTFNKFVVGSNGIMTFDISNVDCNNDWDLQTNPIPFLGTGTCNNAFDKQYPKYSIMGVYHDINPSVTNPVTNPDKKIEWRVEGSAPCRKVIVSFNNIALFGDNDETHTSQIVLYESTGVIEVYIKDKPIDHDGSVWNGNLAILGIQKDQFTALGVTGKNCQQWEEHNTAYQFVPSGGASRFVKAEVLNINHSFIALGDTTTTSAGVLDISFPSFCPTGNTGQYVVRTTFVACDNVANQLVSYDTITINKTSSLNASLTITPTSCGISGSGTATVVIPSNLGTPPFSYVLTPIAPAGAPVTQVGNAVFTGLNAGNYSVTVTDAGGSCGNTLPLTIVSTGVLAVDFTATATSCYGASNGKLTITPPNGTPPFTYTIIPANPPNTPVTQTGNNVFNNIAAGNYFLTVKDNAGCEAINLPFTVDPGPSIELNYTASPTSCLGANNGSVVLNPTGTAPFQFAINGGLLQPSNTFNGLGAGTYFFDVRDAVGCRIDFYPIPVDAGNGTLSGTATPSPTSCSGASNGSITVTPTSGSGPYEYSINNGTNWQASNIFSGLAAGTYTVVIREGGLCRSGGIVAVITSGSTLQATISPASTSCSGARDGTITVTPTSGTAPYQFTLDAGAPQASNIFNGVSAGSHTVRIRDASGCVSAALPINITAGPPLTGTVIAGPTACAGVSNGTITVNPANGVAPFTFILDGGVPQAGNIFSNVSAGNHTVVIRSAAGCVSAGIPANVPTGSVVTADIRFTSTACVGVNNGSITITPTNGSAPYSYTIDGGAPQSGNIFTGVSAGTHIVVVRDNFGCMSYNLSVTVTAGSVLTGTVNGNPVSCNGGNDGSILANGTSGSAPYQYSLNGGGNQPSNAFNGLIAGNYTITITDAFGCISAPMPVTINQPTPLAIAASFIRNVNCQGQSNGLIRVNATGGNAPYSFALNAGTFQVADSFAVPAGVYTVTVKDAKNCISVINNISITEPTTLTASIGSISNATCDGGDDGLITINSTGGTAPYQYSVDGSNYQSTNILRARPGVYTVTVKDAHNCSYQIAGVAVGLNNNLVLTPMTDPAPICEGGSIQLQLQSNGTGFLWTPAAVTQLNNATVSNPLANPVQTTLYTVTVTLGICTATDDVNVIVLPAPVPNAGPDGNICYGQNFQLQGSGGVNYSWTPATYLDYATSTGSPTVVQPAKTTSYTLSVVDANNCPSLVTDEVTVIVIPPIKVSVSPVDTVVFAGDRIQLNAYSIGTDYTWSPSSGLNNSNIPNPVATASGNDGDVVTYQVTASTSAGCKGEGYITVRVYKGPDIYIANAFTPNNDGKNDLFIPFPVGIKELKYFRVYNRWGQLIYSTTSLHQGWDGKFSGAEQPSGVYVWMAQAITKDNKIINKKGSVTLIR